MKNFGLLFFLIVLFLDLVNFYAVFGSDIRAKTHIDAEKVIRDSYQLYRNSTQLEWEKIKMKIKYSESNVKEKELERWIKYGPNKKDKIFIEFHKPEYDRGLKLLVHRKTRKSDLIWLKLPSLRRERRISGQDESNYFAETDLTYRDTVQLVGEDVSNYNYKLLDRKSSYAWCIKATPTEEITPVYGQRIFFVDDDLIIRKIEYYDHSNDLIKVQKNKNVIVQDNGKWRIDLLEIVNHRHDRKTITEVLDRKSGNFSQPPSFSKRDLRR